MIRFENHRRCGNRVREKSARCDNSDDVLVVSVRPNGPADLHGRAHSEMHQELSHGRLLGQPHQRELVSVCQQLM